MRETIYSAAEVREAGLRHLAALDLRTTEEIATDEAAQADTHREALTGLPARPGVRR